MLIIETFIRSAVGRMVGAKWLAALVPFSVDVSLTELTLKFFFSSGSCLKTVTYKVQILANSEKNDNYAEV